MKHPDIKKRTAKPNAAAEQADTKAKPFDLWLQRGLHQLYDDVANEPIPDELLRLIEEDRNRVGKEGRPKTGGDDPET